MPLDTLAQEEITPDGHFTIEDPADLSNKEAEKIYRDLFEAMVNAYAQSEDASAIAFPNWQRFNTTPYLSSGHGNRYLNNYGNEKSANYLKLKPGEKMPFGSVLMKDSFTVTKTGEIFPGALFLMEKLSEEAHPDTGDWRYAMIMPDGSLLGDTTGENPRVMDFCHDCHSAVAETDFLFLIPEEYVAK